jgi:hypothetical protein
LPYGAIFFQEGETFDCPLCLEGIWKDTEIVKVVNGEEECYYKADCLKEYVAQNMPNPKIRIDASAI